MKSFGKICSEFRANARLCLAGIGMALLLGASSLARAHDSDSDGDGALPEDTAKTPPAAAVAPAAASAAAAAVTVADPPLVLSPAQARAKAEALLSRLEDTEPKLRGSDEMMSATEISDAANIIRADYVAGGITITWGMEGRIMAACIAANKGSAERHLAILESSREELYDMPVLAAIEQGIRANYAAAGVTVDPTLDKRIKDAIAHAHTESALFEFHQLKDMDDDAAKEWTLDLILQTDKDIRDHYQAAGVAMTPALNEAIVAAVNHAKAEIGVRIGKPIPMKAVAIPVRIFRI